MRLIRMLAGLVPILTLALGLAACGGGGGGGDGGGGGGGSNTPVQVAAPGTPTALNATAANGSINITWAAVDGATSYNVYWSNAIAATPANSTRIPVTTTSYTLSGLSNGTPYYIFVTAAGTGGESAPTASVSATPAAALLQAPTGVTAVPAATQVTIAWIAVAGASSYNVYWSTSPGVTPANGIRVSGASNPQQLTALPIDVTVYVVVTAVSENGESPPSATVSASTGSGGAVAFTDYPGNWAGSWHNNTFGTSGAATLAVALDATGTKMTWTIAVQGNVFGGAAPPPETFTGTVGAKGITLSGNSLSFGALLLIIDAKGAVTGSGTSVNSPNVSSFIFFGTWTSGGFNLTYTANLTGGGTATGTFQMNKQ